MIQLMKRKVDLKSLEEDRSVILTNHMHWNHIAQNEVSFQNRTEQLLRTQSFKCQNE